jgi:hypothetical protein
MKALLKLLEAGKFVYRIYFAEYGLRSKRSFDNAIYRLKKQGYDIRDIDEPEGKSYYMRQTRFMSEV